VKKLTILIIVIILIAVCFCSPVLARLNRIYVIVNMDNAPIEISEFGKYRAEDEDHISSVVKYNNKTGRDIEALAITMIYFDAFNEKEDGVKGISTDRLNAHKEDSGGWSTYGEPGFVKTAMAYVSAVRFLDGEIWKADTDEVFKIAGKIPELSFLSETEMIEVKKE